MRITDLKIGDTLSSLRGIDNFYIPFGNAEVRLVEDIFTGDARYVRTDGERILELLDSASQPQFFCGEAEISQLSLMTAMPAQRAARSKKTKEKTMEKTNPKVEGHKALFVEQWTENVHREGADKLLEWLKASDFFSAPASVRRHGDHEGGLCEHSLNVFRQFARICNTYKAELGISSWKDKAESIAICSLLHDVCKVGCYKTEMRNKKDENGQWIQVPFYTFDEDNPMGGHGFKSVFLISDFMKLTDEERVAIANHMGPYDRAPGDYALGGAFEMYPFAFLLHVADSAATFMDEKKED